jgi:hypothetical protein
MASELDRTAGSLKRLYTSGALSKESADALTTRETVLDISKGLGETTSSPEVLLVSILVDDSTSIAINIGEICFGYDQMLQALRAEPFTADVQVHTRALNRGVISPYVSLAKIRSLTDQGYSGSRLVSETPLYLQSLLTLGTVMTKAQEEEDRGAKIRTFTLIITDGEDNTLGETTAAHVRAVVTDMLEFSTNNIVAGMGVGERRSVDFRQVFRSMGIPERWIFTPGTSIEELRAVFREIAETLCLAASSETEFLQLVAGSGGA